MESKIAVFWAIYWAVGLFAIYNSYVRHKVTPLPKIITPLVARSARNRVLGFAVSYIWGFVGMFILPVPAMLIFLLGWLAMRDSSLYSHRTVFGLEALSVGLSFMYWYNPESLPFYSFGVAYLATVATDRMMEPDFRASWLAGTIILVVAIALYLTNTISLVSALIFQLLTQIASLLLLFFTNREKFYKADRKSAYIFIIIVLLCIFFVV